MMRAFLTRNKSGLLSGLLLLFLFASALVAPGTVFPAEKNFIWKVRSKTATVYLLGSIHYMKKDAYPLHIVIEDAFSRSNVLAVEANVTDPDKLYFSKFIESVFYPGEDTLANHVSRATYELVTKEFDKYGLPAEILAKEKPWFLALTLTALELLKSGFEPQYGIDMHFLSKAGQKRIVEMESLEQQMDLLSKFSDPEQEAFLVHTIKELDTLGRESDSLLQAWKAGDANALESIMAKGYLEDRGMASVYEKLIYTRNRSMAAKVEELLQSKDTCFVVVGAGHMVGKRGIVELLRAKGYAVEQM
jgi:uncharacterized protein YbaP (TraB family)